MTRIISIQYLRAAAALAVLVFHALESTNHRMPVGAAGVDLFFIISGFVMGLLLVEPAAEPRSFLWRRFVRIAPFYWVATLVTAALWSIKPDYFPWMSATPLDLLRTVLFIPYTPEHGVSPVLWQGWTLQYEVAFYGLCALALFATPRDRLGIVFAALLAIGLAQFAVEPKGVIAKTLISPLLLEFALGLVLCVLWRTRRLPSAAIGAGAIAAGAMMLVLSQISGHAPENYARVLWWGTPSFLIAVGALALELHGRLPKLPGGATLGDASFALYLLHPIALASSSDLFPAFTPNPIRVPAAIAGAVLMALAAHFWFERPMLAALRRLGRSDGRGKLPAAPAKAPIANPVERL